MALNSLGLGFTFTAKDLASATIQGLNKQFGALDNAANRANDRMAKGGKKAGEETKKLLDGMGKSFERIGVVSSVAGAAIVGALGYATAKAAEFGKAIALVASEADLAVFPQKEMERVALQLSQTFGKMPVDEANALYKAVALGANDATKATQLLTGANLLSIAGNADLTLVMNALGGAVNAYGGDMSKATSFSDALFVAMKNGNTTVEELAGSIGRVTSSAANLNISIDEVLAGVSVMTNKGVQASEAVSGLKEALANVVHPSADAAAEAARLGIKFDATTLRSMGLQKFLTMITSSSKFTANSMNKLFTSVEGANAVIQITSGNMATFNATMGEMAKKAGATQKGFEILNATLDQQKAKATALLGAAWIKIGQVLEPLAAKILGVANAIVEAFLGLPAPIQDFLVKGAAIAGVILTVVGAVAGLIGIVLASDIPLLAMAAAIGGVAQGMLPLIVVGGLVAATIYGLKRAFDQNLGGIRDTVLGVVGKVTLAFKALGQLFSDGGFSGDVMAELGKAENSGIKQFAINVFMWVNRIKAFFGGLMDGFNAAIDRAAPIFARLSEAFQRLGKAFGFLAGPNDPAANAKKFDQFTAAGGRVGDILATVVEWFVKAATWVTNFVSAIVEGVGKAWPHFQRIGDAVMRVADQVYSLWKSFDRVRGGTDDAGSALERLGSFLAFSIQGFATALEWSIKFVEVGLKPIVYVADQVSRAFVAVRDTVAEVFRELVKSVLNAVLQLAKVLDSAGAAVGKNFHATAAVQKIQTGVLKSLNPPRPVTAAPALPAAAAAVAAAPTAAGGPLPPLVTRPAPLSVPSASPAGTVTPAAVAAQAAAGAQGGASTARDAAMVQALQQIAVSQAAAAKSPAPFVVMLDGEKISEGMANRSAAGGARSFAAQPPPR